MMNKKYLGKKLDKNQSKLKIPGTSNKAYKKLIKNMSMFSLESPSHGFPQGKTTFCKNPSSKKMEMGKKKRKNAG